jgi:hypothetical protein
VTGKVAFDEFGDTTSKVLTVYKVDGGKPGRPRRRTNSSKPLLRGEPAVNRRVGGVTVSLFPTGALFR